MSGHGHVDPSNKKVALLTWIAGGLGLAGVVFCSLGFFAPTAVHLF